MHAFFAPQTGGQAVRHRLASLGCLIALSACALLLFFPPIAQAGSGQAGPKPILLDPIVAKPIDNIAVLSAAAADRMGVDVWVPETYKYYWTTGFDSTADSYAWTVNVGAATDFHVDALLTGNTSEVFQLAVKETGAKISFSTTTDDWDKVHAGVIRLPAGTSTLVLTKLVSNSDSSVKSLELVRNSDYAALKQRAAAFHRSTASLKGAHGYFTQWGAWSYPKNGPTADINTLANNFDIPRFVAEVKKSQADYVLWSITWIEYEMLAPIQSVNNILGNSKFTSKRDLIGEIADALNDEGIQLHLYYHTGQSTYASGFWEKQGWPTNFNATGEGDRSTFFNNWKTIITEIGQRYGRKLAGWWFDDGLIYYPANFEELGQIARSGNPDRLIGYNSWIAMRYTDFQDYFAGELSVCQPAWPIDANGYFTSGPQEGLFYTCTYFIEDGNGIWGISEPSQNLFATAPSVEQMAGAFQGREPTAAMTMNVLMWNAPDFVTDTAANIGAGALATGNAFVKPPVPYLPKTVSVAADGELAVLPGGSGNTAPTVRMGAAWKTLPGGLTQLSVAGQSRLWGLNAAGQIWFWNDTAWTQISTAGLPANPVRISATSDGAVYVLTDYAGSQYRIWQRSANGSWVQLPGALAELSGVSATELWGVNAAGQLWHWSNGSWAQASTSGASTPAKLSAGTDGTLVTLGADGSIWSRNAANGAWQRIPGGLSNVAVRRASEIWGTNPAGQLWRWSGTGWTQAQ